MDPLTKERVTGKGPISGTWAYITGRPDNKRVTVFDRLVTAFSRTAMFLILLGVGLTFFEVLMRYLVGRPTIWVNEAVLWTGSAIYLFAGAYTMQRRAHIRITAVYDIVSRKTRLVFDYIALIVIVVYAVLMLVGSHDVAWKAFSSWERFGTVFNPPIPATMKPLVLIVTLVVAGLALNNILVDWFGRGKADPNQEDESHPKEAKR